MAHWSESYIGSPYIHNELDCGNLVTRVRKEVFHLPVPEAMEMKREESLTAKLRQIKNLFSEYGEKTDTPQEGDAVLMYCAGRPGHIGVYCEVNNDKCVLHAMEKAGMVVLHRISDLERYFLKVEGYYKWK